jgi:CubicO group peptidase (beta-lactamase class C family)
VLASALKDAGTFLTSTIDPKATPGFSAGLMYKGKLIWSQGGGTVNRSLAVPKVPVPDTIFRIGSISKVFPVLTLYQLIEQGKIRSIDDSVDKYCSDFSIQNPFPKASKNTPTWRQLASQISGLPREAPCPPNDCNFTSDDMFDRIAQMSMISPAWTRGSYSNLAFSILGRAQEYIVKESFETLCQREILTGLGLSNTGFNTSKVAQQIAVGYYADGSAAPLVDIGWSAPAGQMYSSVRDLLTLATTLMSAQDTQLLSQATLGELLAPLFMNADGETLFGTPWEARFQNGYLLRRKGGNIDGYAAFVAMVPELHLASVVMWNGQVDEFEVADAFLSTALPALSSALSSLQPPPALPPNPAQYAGTYTSQDPPITGVVTVVNNTLVITGDMSLTLNYISPSLLSIVAPSGVMSCLDLALNGIQGEYVQFAGPGTEKNDIPFVAFSIPGLLPGYVFNRVKSESA